MHHRHNFLLSHLAQAEEDARKIEVVHDRFVLNDIARAAARQLVGGGGLTGSDANARALLAVADLSGNDNIVTKKRRAGSTSASANLYGYSADDNWDGEGFGEDGGATDGRYLSASSLAEEDEDDAEYVSVFPAFRPMTN